MEENKIGTSSMTWPGYSKSFTFLHREELVPKYSSINHQLDIFCILKLLWSCVLYVSRTISNRHEKSWPKTGGPPEKKCTTHRYIYNCIEFQYMMWFTAIAH